MSAKAGSAESKFDSFKWLVALLLVAVGVAGNSYFAGESLLYRVLALLLLAAAAGFMALQTAKGSAFFTLFKEAKVEIRKVVWPTRQETIQTTLIVVVVVLIAGLALWAIDSLLSWAVSGIIG
ncbi:MAG: preprotein translocase subunit SecE [Motiliproteus sp.]